MNSTREFITFGAKAFERLGQPCGMFDFFARHGREMFAPEHLPPEYREWKGPMKQCFHNAANAAFHDRDLIYCEGYASSIIPILHAWCLDPDGRVLELTWSTPGQDYFGIPFRRNFLIEQAIQNGKYGLVDRLENEFALVRGLYPRKDWFEKKALTRLSAQVKLHTATNKQKSPGDKPGLQPKKGQTNNESKTV